MWVKGGALASFASMSMLAQVVGGAAAVVVLASMTAAAVAKAGAAKRDRLEARKASPVSHETTSRPKSSPISMLDTPLVNYVPLSIVDILDGSRPPLSWAGGTEAVHVLCVDVQRHAVVIADMLHVFMFRFGGCRDVPDFCCPHGGSIRSGVLPPCTAALNPGATLLVALTPQTEEGTLHTVWAFDTQRPGVLGKAHVGHVYSNNFRLYPEQIVPSSWSCFSASVPDIAVVGSLRTGDAQVVAASFGEERSWDPVLTVFSIRRDDDACDTKLVLHKIWEKRVPDVPYKHARFFRLWPTGQSAFTLKVYCGGRNFHTVLDTTIVVTNYNGTMSWTVAEDDLALDVSTFSCDLATQDVVLTDVARRRPSTDFPGLCSLFGNTKRSQGWQPCAENYNRTYGRFCECRDPGWYMLGNWPQERRPRLLTNGCKTAWTLAVYRACLPK